MKGSGRGRRHGEVWETAGGIFVAVRRRNSGWDMLTLAGNEDEEADAAFRCVAGELVWWHDSSFRARSVGKWEE